MTETEVKQELELLGWLLIGRWLLTGNVSPLMRLQLQEGGFVLPSWLELWHECVRTLPLLATSLMYVSLSGGQRDPKIDDQCSVKRRAGLAVHVHPVLTWSLRLKLLGHCNQVRLQFKPVLHFNSPFY